jgi:hypothetical protein
VSRWGVAADEEIDEPKMSGRTGKRRPVLFTPAGERIRPIHKPYKRTGCVWVDSIGWVWNPSGRAIS